MCPANESPKLVPSGQTATRTTPHRPEYSTSTKKASIRTAPKPLSQAKEEDDHVPPQSRHLGSSSPMQPFPELDPDLEAELALLSPRTIHETGTHGSPECVSLPVPAVDRAQRHEETGSVVQLCVTWVGEKEKPGEDGMKEATRRQLEWARKMLKQDLESDEEKSERTGNDHSPAR